MCKEGERSRGRGRGRVFFLSFPLPSIAHRFTLFHFLFVFFSHFLFQKATKLFSITLPGRPSVSPLPLS